MSATARTPVALRTVRAARAALVLSGLVLGLLVAPALSTSQTASAIAGSNSPFDCTGAYLYSIDHSATRSIQAIPVSGIGSGAPVTATAVTTSLVNSTDRNAFAISTDGNAAYFIATVSRSNYIYRFDPTAGTNTQLASSPVAPPFGGAYDPVNGFYYFGNTGVGSALYAYDTVNSVLIGQVGTLPANATSSDSGGDLAFDNAGDLFWTNGSKLYNLPATAVPSTAGTASLANATLVSTSTAGNEPGIAFDPLGNLYEVTGGAAYSKVNPITGATSSGSQGSQGTGTNVADMASCQPPSSLTVASTVPDRTNPGDQFTLQIAPTGGTPASVTTIGSTTGRQQETAATIGVVGLSYTVSETAAGTTDLANYTSSYACTDSNHPGDNLNLSGSGTSVSFAYPTGTNRRIVCTFTNTPKTGSLTVSTTLAGPRNDNADQFTTAVYPGSTSTTPVNSTAASTTTGSGQTVDPGTGTTAATTVVATRTYYLAQALAAGSASAAAQYTSTITCTDASNLQPGLPSAAPFTGRLAITPVAGSDISCVLSTATVAPTLRFSVGLGGPRASDTDQFAVSIRTGSDTGPVVNDPSNAVTTGTGSTVTAGTGTTGTYTGTTGTTYYLTEAASGHAGRYSGDITCTDADNYQAGLPSAQPYTGSLALTPVAGSAISCELTTTATPGTPNLGLAVTGPASLAAAVPAQYSFTVANTGDGDAGSATVSVVLPSGLAYDSATGAACTTAGQVLTCTVAGPIAASDSASFVITATPSAAADGDSEIVRAAVDPSAGSSPVDPSSCTGSATPSAGCAVSSAQTIIVAQLELLATAAPVSPATPPVKAGDHLQFTYTVTNNSQVTLESLSIVDATAGTITCTATTLAAGDSTTCTAAPYVVTQADVDAGSVDTSAQASATLHGCLTGCAVTSPGATTHTPTLSNGAVTVSLAGTLNDTNGNGRADAGETITYAATVTNTGTVTVNNVVVTGQLGELTCPNSVLTVGSSMVCTGTYTVTQADAQAGQVVNSATAMASTPSDATVSAPATAATVVMIPAGPASSTPTSTPTSTSTSTSASASASASASDPASASHPASDPASDPATDSDSDSSSATPSHGEFGAAGNSGHLSDTGGPFAQLGLAGALCLTGGSLIMLLTRRRRRRSH